MANNDKTQITIGTPKNPLQLSYPHVFEPHAINADQPAKYMATILIDKSDTETVNAIKAAMKAAAERGKEKKWHRKMPTKLNLALLDGDEEEVPGVRWQILSQRQGVRGPQAARV